MADEDLTYEIVHQRVRRELGNPEEYACAHCLKAAKEWAYDHLDPEERRNTRGRDDGPFSVDFNHYMPLCVKCHRIFDNGRRAQRLRSKAS